MDLTRRSFLRGVLTVSALSVVPVKAMSLMPALPRIYADGIHCDSDGLEAALARKPFVCDAPDVLKINDKFLMLENGNFLISRRVLINDFDNPWINGCRFIASKEFDDEVMLEAVGKNTGGAIMNCYFDTSRSVKLNAAARFSAINMDGSPAFPARGRLQ